MMEPSGVKAHYVPAFDGAVIGEVTAIRPAPTPEQIKRREEIWEFCNRITWRRLKKLEQEFAERDAREASG